MTMLIDLLKQIELPKTTRKMIDGYMEKPPSILEGDGIAASKQMTPDAMNTQRIPKDPATVYNDAGNIVGWNDFFGKLQRLSGSKDLPGGNNPFSEAISKSRANENTRPGVLRQLLSSVLGGGMVPGTGTVGGDPAGISGPTHTPGTRQDAALSSTPMKDQPQPSFQLPPTPISQPRPDYSQPSALDPVAIEQLRQSLLTDSGQMDPNNPNGLSGRMNDPNSQVDMNNQRKESQTIEDSVRGFDGSIKANIQEGNQ